jgi:hypothetical protein
MASVSFAFAVYQTFEIKIAVQDPIAWRKLRPDGSEVAWKGNASDGTPLLPTRPVNSTIRVTPGIYGVIANGKGLTEAAMEFHFSPEFDWIKADDKDPWPTPPARRPPGFEVPKMSETQWGIAWSMLPPTATQQMFLFTAGVSHKTKVRVTKKSLKAYTRK